MPIPHHLPQIKYSYGDGFSSIALKRETIH